MTEENQRRRQTAKWVIGIFTICILIYLGISNINIVASAFAWLADLLTPFLIGMTIALFLNIPLGSIEKHLFQKNPTPRKKKLRRPLAIVLSLVLMVGVIIALAVIIIPQFIEAVGVVITSLSTYIKTFSQWLQTADLSEVLFSEQLASIDFTEIQNTLSNWLKQLGTAVADGAVNIVGSTVSNVVNFFLGLVFSIHILANKEKLKLQASRLIHAWLPEGFGNYCIHVVSIFNKNFKLYVSGQVTEAVILGCMCLVGMLILRLPYAPMISVLVGIGNLIPYVGAWIAGIFGIFMILTVSPFKALVFLIFLLAIQQFEGNIIYPKVVGGKVNLQPMWVLAAITLGGGLAGLVGMLFSVPTVASLYTLIKEATVKREKKKAAAVQASQAASENS